METIEQRKARVTREPLVFADITALVAAGGTKRSSNGSQAKNRWFDGTTWHAGKPPLDSNVHFEGRAGTIRRSRKGATRRNANGRRYVVGQYGHANVVAYKVSY